MVRLYSRIKLMGMLAIAVSIPMLCSCRAHRTAQSQTTTTEQTATIATQETTQEQTQTQETKDSTVASGWKIEFYPPTDSVSKQAVKSISYYGKQATRVTTAVATATANTTATENTTAAATTATATKESKSTSTATFPWWLTITLLLALLILAYYYVKRYKK